MARLSPPLHSGSRQEEAHAVMSALKYSELLRKNRELGEALRGPEYRIAVLSNVITTQLDAILEYTLRSAGVNARVTTAPYDNIPQGSVSHKGHDLAVVFWEPANLVDGLHYRAEHRSHDDLAALADKVKAEIDFVRGNLAETPLVLWNGFSSLLFSHGDLRPGPFERLARDLDAHLRAGLPKNILAVDVDRIIAQVSVGAAADFRLFHSSKALYTVAFYEAWCRQVAPAVLAARGKAKKALILDCDNTLWRGILGEDGPEGLRMSPDTPEGLAFHEVQHLVKGLTRRGVLVGLCSKNNPEDVDRVLREHPAMTLRPEDIAIRMVNWSDKADNLREIGRRLNIGLDSLVFVDDSPFELERVREAIPEIAVVPVPERLHAYPAVLRDAARLFFRLQESSEDAARTAMYLEEATRTEERARFQDVGEYLASLKLQMRVHFDEASLVPRAAQLTQKTNQWNLTTRRYTEAEVARFVASPDHRVATFELRDRFGDYGVVGLAIAEFRGDVARIDTFLMSCRVIGRGAESVFLSQVLADLEARGVRAVEAEFIPTAKNEVAARFLDGEGFTALPRDGGGSSFTLALDGSRAAKGAPIEVVRGRAD